MRLPRMTTRRWMVLVATVAILIGVGLELGRRSSRFARLSAYHSEVALLHFHTLMRLGGWPPQDPLAAELGRGRNLYRVRALVHYHSALTGKYERAARYPWLPVAPDPTEPE
jgi:hypothetical protein